MQAYGAFVLTFVSATQQKSNVNVMFKVYSVATAVHVKQ